MYIYIYVCVCVCVCVCVWRGESLPGIIANVLAFDMLIKEFELQLHDYVLFQTNRVFQTYSKVWNTLFHLQLRFEKNNDSSFTRMCLASDNPRKLICHLTKNWAFIYIYI